LGAGGFAAGGKGFAGGFGGAGVGLGGGAGVGVPDGVLLTVTDVVSGGLVTSTNVSPICIGIGEADCVKSLIGTVPKLELSASGF
jgi:hypothetical protein